IASKAVPADLVSQVAAMFPSFGQEWMDDRTRSLATRYLLRKPRPDLVLVHFVDLDSEAHDNGPFSSQANAILEYTDELIGSILADLPREYAFVLVSDHGFERVDREINLHVIAASAGVQGVRSMGGIAVAETEEAAAFLRKTSGVGREIPRNEVSSFAQKLSKATAIFEPAPNVWFGSATAGEPESKPHEVGTHGHWLSRYRSVYLAWARV
ncbi:MAG: alkaline phosphatase family protein, partial [Bryobacteraceae bacterium]